MAFAPLVLYQASPARRGESFGAGRLDCPWETKSLRDRGIQMNLNSAPCAAEPCNSAAIPSVLRHAPRQNLPPLWHNLSLAEPYSQYRTGRADRQSLDGKPQVKRLITNEYSMFISKNPATREILFKWGKRACK
jgi:hypothetical protein